MLLERGGLDDKHSKEVLFRRLHFKLMATRRHGHAPCQVFSILIYISLSCCRCECLTLLHKGSSVAVPQFTNMSVLLHPTFGDNFKQYDRFESKRCCYSG
jgi:hypothetical protein